MADHGDKAAFPVPDWTRGQILLGWGAVLNSMLYVAGCFVMAAMIGDRIAGLLAIACAGVTFLSYSFRLYPSPAWSVAFLHFTSWALGIGAGLSLIYKVIA